jgi:hypothetical protein
VKRVTVAALLSGLMAFLTLGLSGCGTSSPPPIVVTLTPSSTQSMDQAQTAPITAAVANDSKSAGVTWSVTGGGTLSPQTTSSATYNAPATVATAFTATVTATSITDATKMASLQIKVSPPPTVSINSLPAATAGTAYNQTLSVSGGTSPYTWSITAGTLPAGLSLNASTGAITGTPTGAGSNSVTFQVTDAAKDSASQIITITVTAPPALTITTATLPAGTTGTAYSQTLQATGGVPSYTWSKSAGNLPAGLSLSSAGVISGTPSGTFTGTSSFTVTLTDSQTPVHGTTAANLSITVSAPPLSVTTASLAGGTIGTAYSNQTLQATGGIAPYTWAVTSGSLPAGLSLNAATGVISGTPGGTFVGTDNFTVTVTDSETLTAKTANANLSIAISVAPLSVTTSGSLATGVVNSIYPGATLQATGGITPYSWTVTTGSLPAGLLLNAATGAISGTPTASGTATFTVTVTDSETPTAKTATANLTIVVNPAVMVTTTSLPAGVIGTAYPGATLAATGGISPYTWAVTTGSLPAGLSLNASTGAISGTPSGNVTGTINFTVTVADSETPTQKTETANLSITITATTLKVTTTSLAGGSINVAYSNQTLQSTGGIAPITWSVTTGSLPAGLTLNAATGVISGTPSGTSVGQVNFTVTATDSETPTQQTASAALSITITVAALSVTTSGSLPTGVVNSVYSGATLQATGGILPYSWAVTTGSLPAGLLLNAATGVISGRPTAPSTANFTVTVTDSETPTAKTATANLTIVVNPAVVVTTNSLPAGVIGTAYPGATLAATGGISPYTWAVTTGSLPAGLSLNATTGVISGTPSGTFTGTTNFTITVTDSESPTQKTATANLSITITATTLKVTTTTSSLPIGVTGNTYNATLQASGGITPITWGYTGTLPTGVSLSSAGVFSGTPSATGPYNFTVTATDSETPTAQTASANLSISVNNSAPLAITTTGLPGGVVNTSYQNAMLQANGGVQPYTWSISAGTLPTGLSLSSAGCISSVNCAITGTPTTPGTSNFTVKVADSTQPTSLTQTLGLSITINGALTITTTSPLSGGNVGTQYNATVNATGGLQPYAWSITGGSLPPGLALNSNGGNVNINGTPTTTGTYNFTIQVIDNENPQVSVSQNLSIIIESAAPLTIQTTTLPGASEGWAYNTSLQANGGVQPYSWSIASGSLPAGLTLISNSGNGNITGTPTTVTGTPTPSFTITVTDSDNVSTSASVSIAVTNCPNNANFKGNYAMLLQGWSDSASGEVYTGMAGSFVADGAGNITQGMEDFNDPSDGYSQGTFTGNSYCVAPDNLGFMTIGSGSNSRTLAFSLQSSGNGNIIFYDASTGFQGSGVLLKQTTSAFSLAQITGPYALELIGADMQGGRYGMGGVFTANGTANLTNGELDMNDSGLFNNGNGPNNPLSFSSNDLALASNGRGTVGLDVPGLGTLNFAFYVVNASQLLLVETDLIGTNNSLLTGQILQQIPTQGGAFNNASLNGVSVIELQGMGGSPEATAGFVTTDGAGTFSINADQNQGGTMGTLCASGTYTVAANGRMTLPTFTPCGGPGGGSNPVFYVVAKNQTLVVGTDGSVTFGTMTPQAGSGFTVASLNGNYLGGTQQPVASNVKAQVLQIDADGAGNVTGIEDQTKNCGSGCGGPESDTFTGTYTVSNGKVTLNANGVVQAYIYIISGSQVSVLPVSSSQNQSSNPDLMDLHQ